MFVSSVRKTIADLSASGLSQSEIARELDLAVTTVSYHLERMRNGVPEAEYVEPLVRTPRRTRDAVRRLLGQGLRHVEIARQLGISKATVSYHVRCLGAAIDDAAGRRYDWEAVQRHYDQGHSIRDCMGAFGFSASSWSDAVRRGALVPRPTATPLSELLVQGTYRGRQNVKQRLIKAGVKDGSCERCGLWRWLGEPLNVELHHVNGDRLDNRLENLELLCPNCHSQTTTYSGRNGHRRQMAR